MEHGTVQDENDVMSVYVVPGNYYKVDVPTRILHDPVSFERYVEAILAERDAPPPWHQRPIPAWVFVLVVSILAIALVLATLWPLGIDERWIR